MNNPIASAARQIDAAFAARQDGSEPLKCFITGENYVAYAKERDAILEAHGITLKDYLTWCEEQEQGEEV